MGWGATKGLVGLGTSGAINGAMAVRVTRDAERERFLFQDVIIELIVDFPPCQQRVSGGHVAEGSVVHYPGGRPKLPAEFTNLVLVGQEIRSEEREVVKDYSQVNIPGLQPGMKSINPAFALL